MKHSSRGMGNNRSTAMRETKPHEKTPAPKNEMPAVARVAGGAVDSAGGHGPGPSNVTMGKRR